MNLRNTTADVRDLRGFADFPLNGKTGRMSGECFRGERGVCRSCGPLRTAFWLWVRLTESSVDRFPEGNPFLSLGVRQF